MNKEFDILELDASIKQMDGENLLQFRSWAEHNLSVCEGELKTKRFRIEKGMSVEDKYWWPIERNVDFAKCYLSMINKEIEKRKMTISKSETTLINNGNIAIGNDNNQTLYGDIILRENTLVNSKLTTSSIMKNKYVVYIRTQMNRVNIIDIFEDALVHVVEAFLNKESTVMLGGRKIFLKHVWEFKIFKFENQDSIDGFLGACNSRNLFEKSPSGETYLPPNLFLGISEDVSSYYLDDFNKKNMGTFPEEKVLVINKTQVFIVHGHDELAKTEVARFIQTLGFEPIILHEQASSGKTIIEKIEEYSNVGFGIALYTPCDQGSVKGQEKLNDRARQNVVFEHGYLIGKIGRHNVCALVKGIIETPNDISGVVYISMNGGWHLQLAKELKNSGYEVDMNRLA
ncbi:hypothetical protein BH09BAC5_BH09BAC5_00770 [soil metagenome]